MPLSQAVITAPLTMIHSTKHRDVTWLVVFATLDYQTKQMHLYVNGKLVGAQAVEPSSTYITVQWYGMVWYGTVVALLHINDKLADSQAVEWSSTYSLAMCNCDPQSLALRE